MASKNIFPPIVESFMPAFVYDTGAGAKIVFDISPYNSKKDLANDIQISVVDPKTNKNLLNTELGILYSGNTWQTDSSFYSITIDKEKLAQGNWILNKYYKVQLRFYEADVNTQDFSNDSAYQTWFYNNGGNEKVSEWSTPCLIYPISKPTLQLASNLVENESEAIEKASSTRLTGIYGTLEFAEKQDEETLYSYHICIYDSNNTIPLYDSGVKYSAQKNEINCPISYAFESGNTYKVIIDYTTKNGYQEQNVRYFHQPVISTTDDYSCEAFAQDDLGRISVKISSATGSGGIITVRRSSSEDNFSTWRDVHCEIYSSLAQSEKWYDYTVESGVWYRYRLAIGESETKETNPIMPMFDDIYLNEGDRQLCVRYNPELTSMSYIVGESKTDTIGSKYTFIRRNAETYYRQFTFGGLISFLSDENYVYEDFEPFNSIMSNDKISGKVENLFATPEELLGSKSISLYTEYKNKYNVSAYNDMLYEKLFRNKVIEWLQNGKVKLFRSFAEGNILVRLTDISFSTQAPLNRGIYSFSCTANEIAPATLEEIDAYNIQPIGLTTKDNSDKPIDKYKTTYIFGQLIARDNSNLVNSINTQVDTRTNGQGNLNNITYLHIEMQNAPTGVQGMLGYIISINGQEIFVNADGFYTLRNDSGLNINSINLNGNAAIIDYKAKINVKEDYDDLPIVSKSTNQTNAGQNKIGQIAAVFAKGKNIIEEIKSRYKNAFTIVKLTIEADKDTELTINDSKFIINDTELLSVSDSGITSCVFAQDTYAIVEYEIKEE